LRNSLVDLFRPQAVAGLLQFLRLRTGEKAVVQGLESDTLLFHLPLRPLVPVQAELQTPGRITARLQEDRPEVLVVDVKVVVIDVDGLVAIVLKGTPLFAARKSLRLLLSHANEHHLVAHAPLTTQPLRYFVLTLAVLEMNQRNRLLRGLPLHRLHPTLGDLVQDHGRRNRLAQMTGQETISPPPSPGWERSRSDTFD